MTLRRVILWIAAVALAVGIYAGLQHFTGRKAEIAGGGHAGAGVAGSSAGQSGSKSSAGSGVTGASANLPAAPELTFIDINGAAVRTGDYKGKVVLVNFWAAWCGPCAEEVPQFVALQKKYQKQGLQVIGISVEDDAGKLRDFCREHQVNYPVVPSDLRIADAFGGVLGLPTTFVIGRDSRIHGKQEGTVDFPLLEQEVVALLGPFTPKAGVNGTRTRLNASDGLSLGKWIF